MDFSDFLLEYDLTEEQRALASRLKAEANLKQLLNALADHALFFGRAAGKSCAGRKRPLGAQFREPVLAWFASLDVPQRVALLSCEDPGWVRTVLRMSRMRGAVTEASGEGRFLMRAMATGTARPSRPAERPRGAANGAGTGGKEAYVHYRRPHRLPDGELLAPPATPAHRRACAALVAGARVVCKGSCSAALAPDWGAVAPSPALVADPKAFAALLDEVSLGRFLTEAPLEPPKAGSGGCGSGGSGSLHGAAGAGASKTPWPEAPWLQQWGTHAPLAAFLASRLEVLLLQGYAAREAHTIQPLPLAAIWATVPAAQRASRLRRLGGGLLRRLLSETLTTGLGVGATAAGRPVASEPLRALAGLLEAVVEEEGTARGATGIALEAFLTQAPFEQVAAITTVSLPAATPALETTMREVLLAEPRLWLHQQFAEELAIVCSEHSANCLLGAGEADEAALARPGGGGGGAAATASRRSEKRQRQKLRRRGGRAPAAAEASAGAPAPREEEHEEEEDAGADADATAAAPAQEQGPSAADGAVSDPVAALPVEAQLAEGEPPPPQPPPPPRQRSAEAVGVQADPSAAPQGLNALATAAALARLEEKTLHAQEWDALSSELSSLGVPNSRSGSVCEGLGRTVAHMSLLESSYWDAEVLRARARAGRTARCHWHDDSRLEFLLRNRDGFTPEHEWDRLSQRSVPASLDEAALYNVGLESRFAYLFDSPSRSRVPTALGSQATAEDEAERLRPPWDDLEDPHPLFPEEWQSLTQALEKTEGEREMWKAKAQELESRLAGHALAAAGAGAAAGSTAACASEELMGPSRSGLTRQGTESPKTPPAGAPSGRVSPSLALHSSAAALAVAAATCALQQPPAAVAALACSCNNSSAAGTPTGPRGRSAAGTPTGPGPRPSSAHSSSTAAGAERISAGQAALHPERRRRRQSTGSGAADAVPAGPSAPGAGDAQGASSGAGAESDLAWRYLVLLALARRQIDLQRQARRSGGGGAALTPPCGADAAPGSRDLWDDTLSPPLAAHASCAGAAPGPAAGAGLAPEPALLARSVSLPVGGPLPDAVGSAPAAAVANSPTTGPSRVLEASRSPSPSAVGVAGGVEGEAETPSSPPPRGSEVRKRALHVTFGARYKRSSVCDSATQTAPAITLSKMYGDMVPRYIQRELARLRQENQILRYRVASLAMSQPIGRPRPVRHQATQTAPALTFSTGGRQQGASSIPRLPTAREVVGLRQEVNQKLCAYPLATFDFEPPWAPPEYVPSALDESIRAFVRAVEAQTQSQDAYRLLVQRLCRRAAQVLWPRSSVELYGSFASGLALPSSGLDLVIYPHRYEPRRTAEGGLDPDHRLLTPIDEDAAQMRAKPSGEVSPGHPSAGPSMASNWQQQLSSRLAAEKWVLADSIRVTAHAAIPVLSFITAPEEDASADALQGEEPLSCPIRVDMSVEDPNHRGLRSKAFISWLLTEFPHARAVTLVLKQMLIERTYGMSHTGGLCSYGLLLMVVGFLQHYPAPSAAAALVACLTFYGRRFDPQEYGVSVARGALLHRKIPAGWPPAQAEYVERGFCPRPSEFATLPRKLAITGEEAHRFDPLWIEDPLNPTNNVGRNCFRIRQIQRSLAHAADALTASEASSQLRTILRVEGQAHGEDGERELGGGAEGVNWRESVTAKQALHEDLFQSLAAHAPNLMLPLPAHAQIARSHLPQQWDSVVRYAARPSGIR